VELVGIGKCFPFAFVGCAAVTFAFGLLHLESNLFSWRCNYLADGDTSWQVVMRVAGTSSGFLSQQKYMCTGT